jgi:isopenicillin-N epimerase
MPGMETVRAHVADYLGCFLNETVMFPSTTLALNAVATGLIESGFLSQGDRVLTTDQEHAGGIAGWVHYSGDADPDMALPPIVSLDRIPLPIPDLRSTEAIVADFKAHLLKFKSTKVLAISHVTTTTGATLPIKEISAMAHSMGVIVVIDGAQAFGMQVDVSDLGVDVYASSAHKWLLAPTGNGIMCIKERLQPHVKSTVLDGGFSSYTRTAGTRPADTTLGLGHALDYLDSYGHSRIVTHSLKLASRAWSLFQKNGFIMLSKQPSADHLQSNAPIVAVSWKNQAITALKIGKMAFQKYGIVVKMTGRKQFPGEWPVGAPNEALRFTFHMFNDEEDVDTLVKGITSILEKDPF